MAAGRIEPIIQHLRRVVLRDDKVGMTDGQLLERFITHRDAAAFEALVRRHGPMVLGVCHRLLGNLHDAEDGFQATFLVLARKAASVSPRERVGNWLYGVAYTTAVRARAANAKRRLRERQVIDMPEPEARRQDHWDDLQLLLDEELARLPDKYRLPIVLCDLEGRPRREIARQLKIPEGTLSSRLTTARRMLAKRLVRRGLAVTVGSLAAMLSHKAAPACVTSSLVSSTVKAAVLIGTGKVAEGVLSVKVAALAEGVVKTMFVNKIIKFSALVLLVSALALGVGGFGADRLNDRTLVSARAGEEKDGRKEPLVRGATTPKNKQQRKTKADEKRERTSSAATMPKTEEKLDEIKLGQKREDYTAIFDNALDAVDDYFEVAYANRYDGRIETCPLLKRPHTPPRFPAGRPAATTKPVRWRAVVVIAPTDEGSYWVDVRIYKEAETKPAKRDEKNPLRPKSPAEVDEQHLLPRWEMNWAPVGRDTEFEQVILRRLVEQERKRRSERPREQKERAERAEPGVPGRGYTNNILLLDVQLDVANPDRTISVVSLKDRPTIILNLPVALDAKIKVKGGSTYRNLKVGMHIILELREENNQLVATGIRQVGIPPE
ncbi:MAG TPA: sigma-70 family RNA polymerase sigma factor [Gemmataceae bacterium]|jgi:RNA polymerase sigma factor (sigma-70 family)